MALPINHYIAVVPILNREKVRENAVACQTANEVRLCFLKLVAEVPFVEIAQVTQLGLLHLHHLLLEGIDRDSVRHELDDGRGARCY